MLMIAAPSNLGLSPLRPRHEPGTGQVPAALVAAGLLQLLNPSDAKALPRPKYSAEAQSNTRLRNGHTIRSFNIALAMKPVAKVSSRLSSKTIVRFCWAH